MRLLENTVQENREYDDCLMCDTPVTSFFHYVTIHNYIPYEGYDTDDEISFNRFLIVKQRVLR
jgi:hypothetical protein